MSGDRIVKLEAWVTRTVLKRELNWTVGGAEQHATYLWLRLSDDAGASGLSETVLKPAWTGFDGPTAMAAVEHLLWPRLAGVSASEGEKAVLGLRGLCALHAAVGHAVRDLLTVGTARMVDLAAVLTRDEPNAMAARAKDFKDQHGLRAFKIKAGQGLDVDTACISAVRNALGGDAALSMDANSAYNVEDGLELCQIAADHGVTFVEDPWPLNADQATGEAIAKAALPICADRILSEVGQAQAILDRGAAMLAIKPNRIGPGQAATMEAAAHAVHADTVAATFGEGCLGAVQQVRGVTGDFAFEAAHWLELEDPIAVADFRVAEGRLMTPEGRADECVDREQLASRAILSWEATHG